MKNFIPHFIEERYQKDETNGQFQAYTMFIDLSGFTPLTETLMSKGNEGAEQLSISLNNIFEPMVRVVYSKKGFIPYFAGDAFTAIFPKENTDISAESLLDTAQQIRELFSKEGLKKTRFGDFQIGIKIGLSEGSVEWGIVGEHFKTFYFRGPAIDDCASSEHRARGQEIILDDKIFQGFQKTPEHLEIEKGFYKLTAPQKTFGPLPTSIKLPPLSLKILQKFLPKMVISFNEMKEFRRVISVFLSFTGIKTHEELNEFTSIVLKEINSFSGYFKEVDFGDKGGVMLGFFGAPISFENNVERALEFVSLIQEELQPLQKKTDLKFRAGITSGLAYTGIVGGEERCQYAAVGNRVNIAARLMIKAEYGEVLVDEEIQKNRQFVFKHQGDIQYKGIVVDIPTYKLIGRNVEEKPDYTNEMIGREKELEHLNGFVLPSLRGEYNGLAYIYGEAGIGKSRLSFELKKRLKAKGEISWVICQADQILKKPFNPYIFALKNYFEQSPENNPKDNQDLFEKHYNWLVEDSQRINHPKAKEIQREIIRTKSILAAQIRIYYPNSLWEQLDAKGRYQNMLAALSNFFIAISLIKPLVIELEDGQWFDNSSKEFLASFVRQVRDYPIFMLVTSRYKDDGTKPKLVADDILGKNQIQIEEVDLNILKIKALNTFAELRLGGKIHQEFSELLMRTTNGNPFYLEQIIEYFSESKLLHKVDGQWHIKENSIKLSNSINSILMARIDRLSNLVKETVKAAAVIGREFEIPVLSEVMKVHEDFSKQSGNTVAVLKEQVSQAEQGQIWRAMNDLRYIFKHSLLREAVYEMQLGTRLRMLHQLIATAIEKLYPESIEERYVDLAFHYGMAEVEDKTNEYLGKAADYAKRNFQNRQALGFYDQLLNNLEEKNDLEEQVKTLLNKGAVLELIGDWDDCENTYNNALLLSKKIDQDLTLGRAHNSLGYLLTLKGNYDTAKHHLEKAEIYFDKSDDARGKARALGNLGNLFFRVGHYKEATAYFTQSIDLNRTLQGNGTNAQIVANLGLTLMNTGKYDEGIKVQRVELKRCERIDDRRGMASLNTNLGIVYFEKGDYDNALKCYEKGLALSEELGNKLLTSIAIGCIGSVYQKKGDFQRAMENYIRDLELCEQLGDKQGTAIAIGLIGELRSEEGEFDVAIQYLEKNLSLCRELGYQKGIAKAVNTLGDIHRHIGEFDKAIEFYDQAIEVSRKINNKLVLGYSLVEKGAVLNLKGEYAKANELHLEALEIAEQLGNPDLLFEAVVFSANVAYHAGEIDIAVKTLNDLLGMFRGKREQSAIYYELFQVQPEEPIYCQKALELYQKLYLEIPQYIFKIRIEELEKKNATN